MALSKINQTAVSYGDNRLAGIDPNDTNIRLLSDVHQHEHTIKVLLSVVFTLLDRGDSIDVPVDGSLFTVEKNAESGEIVIFPDEETLN